MGNETLSPGISLPANESSIDAVTPFFAVSVTKLVVLSLCTFGLYEVYWFYKNWRLIREREDVALIPLARAIFAIFFCYQAFCRIRDFPTRNGSNASLEAGALATGWIITTFLGRLPDPYWLVAFLAVGFMAPVQTAVQRINAEVAPTSDPNSRFSVANWLTVVFGGSFFILAVIGSFMEPV